MPKKVTDDNRLSVRLNYRDTEQGGAMLKKIAAQRGSTETETLRALVREEHRRISRRARIVPDGEEKE